jgi:hypothetical protein
MASGSTSKAKGASLGVGFFIWQQRTKLEGLKNALRVAQLAVLFLRLSL